MWVFVFVHFFVRGILCPHFLFTAEDGVRTRVTLAGATVLIRLPSLFRPIFYFQYLSDFLAEQADAEGLAQHRIGAFGDELAGIGADGISGDKYDLTGQIRVVVFDATLKVNAIQHRHLQVHDDAVVGLLQ